MGYRMRVYLALLDRALLFAARHTGADGRMSVNGEIDCKDAGWLVLGGAVRGVEAGWLLLERRERPGETEPQVRMLPGRLVIRDSAGPAIGKRQ